MSDPALLENHWLACMASVGGGGRVTRLGALLAVVHPRLSPMFANFLTFRAATVDQLPDLLTAGEVLLAERGRPPALFLSPAAGDMEGLGAALAGMGWRCHTRQVVLVRSLVSLDLPEAPPAVVQVKEISREQVGRWGKLLVKAFEVAPSPGQEIGAAWTGLMDHPGDAARARYYLGLVDGKPAGTGLTWLRSGLAGLYCGAVLPAKRRLGVERATLLRRLQDAAASGAHLAMVQTEAGSPVHHLCMNRLGFSLAHERSLWLAPVRPCLQDEMGFSTDIGGNWHILSNT